MSVLRVTTQGGVGGISVHDISAILPDVQRPGHSVVYTDVFPTGLSVDGGASDLCALWFAWLEDEEDEEEDEDDEGILD